MLQFFVESPHTLEPMFLFLFTTGLKTLSSTPQTAGHSGYMTLPTPAKTSLHIPGDIGTELVEQVVYTVLTLSDAQSTKIQGY